MLWKVHTYFYNIGGYFSLFTIAALFSEVTVNKVCRRKCKSSVRFEVYTTFAYSVTIGMLWLSPLMRCSNDFDRKVAKYLILNQQHSTLIAESLWRKCCRLCFKILFQGFLKINLNIIETFAVFPTKNTHLINISQGNNISLVGEESQWT
jgi:hypothetical protein